jgi:hypothetical protein
MTTAQACMAVHNHVMTSPAFHKWLLAHGWNFLDLNQWAWTKLILLCSGT